MQESVNPKLGFGNLITTKHSKMSNIQMLIKKLTAERLKTNSKMIDDLLNNRMNQAIQKSGKLLVFNLVIDELKLLLNEETAKDLPKRKTPGIL